jgi:hypothetical protein
VKGIIDLLVAVHYKDTQTQFNLHLWSGCVFKMQFAFKAAISLAPGFSPVRGSCANHSRFNGFSYFPKPLKRLKRSGHESPG